VFGPVASDVVVGSGSTEYVLPDGTAISTTVRSGGTESVYSGGSAIGTTVSSESTEYVSSGGTASFTTVNSGGTEISGGTEFLYGTDTGTTVNSGGAEFVFSGGTASSTTVRSGGFEVVSSGGAVGGVITIDGSLAATDGLTLGQSGSGATAMTVNSGGTVTDVGVFTVGDNDLGSLSIEAGATVTTTPGLVPTPDGAVIAAQSGASGASVNVTGAGSDWQVGGTLLVGDAGDGSLSINAGATAGAGSLDAGVQSTGAADISVTGAASALTVTGQLTVGDASSADLSIFNGATVTAADGDIGLNAGGAGVVDIEGAGSELDITNNLNIGDAGTGVLVMGVGTTLTVVNGFGIGVNGVFQQFGGVLDPSDFTNKGSVTGGNNAVVNVGSTLVNNGVYAATPGDYTLNIGTLSAGTLEGGTIAGTGSLVIGNAGDLIINAGTVVATQSVEFNNNSTTGTLTIGTLVGFGAAIDSFNTGAEIILAGTSIVSDAFVGNALTLFGAGGAELGTLKFGPNAVSGGFLTTSDGAIVEAPCFAAGTRIATERGEVAVEDLRVGDLVRTVLGEGEAVLGGTATVRGETAAVRGGSGAPIIWIGRREVDCARHPKPKQVWPVRVAAGAFGPGRPHADLFLSPDHAIYVEEVLIPIRHLINDSTIVQVPMERVTYYHVELPEHDVLLAEGMPAESYLDMRDGSNYANAPGPIRLYPDYAARMWEAFGCARLVVTGPELEGARASVGCFAEAQTAA
jgi:autotransporter passenger strand-loop-strand repeat protein/T5SS/PEP-CTERM-associated repeat protein